MKASRMKLATAALVALMVAACGGGGGGGGTNIGTGGTGGTGISSGTIERIGSVQVNGVTFSCEGAVIEDDDGTIDQGSGDNCVGANQSGELDEGMVVTIDGNASSNPPLATKVKIRPRLRGPIQSIDLAANRFVVLGQTVLVDGDTKFKINGDKTKTIADLRTTTMTVQVHGFANPDGTILATFVKTKNPSAANTFEVKGIIDVAAGVIRLGNLTISVNGFTSPALVDGMCVELKGIADATGSSLTLSRAPKTDDDCDGLGDDLERAEIEGIVSGFTAANAEFKVNEQRVILASSVIERDGTVAEDLINGAKVEVEGRVSDGLLTASKITFKRSVRIQAVIDSVDSAAKTASALGITIKWDSATRVEDPLVAGQPFEIRGRKSGATQITAIRIREKDDNDTELRGPVDAKPAAGATAFTILGVQIQTSAATEFEGRDNDDNDDDNIGQAAFFAALNANDVVKAKGSETNNAIAAEEVEFEND